MNMNEGKLLKGVLAFVLILLAISFMFPHQPKLKSLEEFSFETTSDSRLHFNNIRSFWYYRTEEPEQGIVRYDYKKWDVDIASGLRPEIITLWKRDEAILMLRPMGTDTTTTRYLVLGADTLKIDKGSMDRDAYIETAMRWYQHLDTTASYSILNESREMLEVSEDEVKAVKAVLTDYFTLVRFLD
ncbi:hypothetical protein [Phaeocystidibacter luteus]|uniref:Uncharacterized protein n=1 Tax=Phaeocystidibacter luteus TaxID=911197 RepID=A0A6N6RK12_9FLAO|nr:hypothetical protein [Phaeocystidibacter luteus]KAB2814205.1 hypothetical protein F8C67_00310 [Phaeocystidibacter luteus]